MGGTPLTARSQPGQSDDATKAFLLSLKDVSLATMTADISHPAFVDIGGGD